MLTDGSSRSHDVQGASGPIKVRAPGLVLDVRVLALPVAANRPSELFAEAIRLAPAAGPDTFDELAAALETEGFSPVDAVVLRPGTVNAPRASVRAASIVTPQSARPHVQLSVNARAGEGVVAVSVTAGIVQFHVGQDPAVSAPRTALATMAFRDPGAVALTAMPPPARTVEFFIPAPPDIPTHGEFALDRLTALAAGVGSVGSKVVKFFRFTWIADLVGDVLSPAVQAAARAIESRSKQEQMLQGDLTPVAIPPCLPGRSLLFVHGIFSSFKGAFRDVWDASIQPDLGGHLRGLYGSRIFGYDHWTVTKTPLENATDLLNLLPQGFDFDLVCHSRGGLVVRALLEHPNLQPQVQAKNPRVGRAVFVAGANQGSPLAREANWKKLLEVFGFLGSIPGEPPWLSVSVDVLVGFLKIAAHAIARMPSVADLSDDPSNAFVVALNQPPHTPLAEYLTVRAHYGPRTPSWFDLVAPAIDLVFEHQPNDLVVPFEGARRFDPYVEATTFLDDPYGTMEVGQDAIWHTNFFRQTPVRQSLQAVFV